MKNKILIAALAVVFLTVSSYLFRTTLLGLVEQVEFVGTERSSNAGHIPGTLTVSSVGMSEYAIDLVVPPGTNGLQPDLKLTYGSHNKNGILGVGWALNGISIIKRIGKSIPQDGIKTAVEFSEQDRFTFDGQRIIAYKDAQENILNSKEERDAAYGKDGTEYRTEVESWVRIFSEGSCNGGPCSFSVYLKDGSVLNYGQNENSLLEKDDKTVICWPLEKQTDKNGNYLTITYIGGAEVMDIYPHRISYTGNTETALPPQRLVEFYYETRADSTSQYLAGENFVCDKRISSISTYVDRDGNGLDITAKDNLVTSYQISYEYNQATGRSAINAIKYCDSEGVCMAPTTFKWSGIDAEDSFSDTLSLLPESFADMLSDDDVKKVRADFDADGKIDIALLKSKSPKIPVLFSNSDGGFDLVTAEVPKGYSVYLNEADIEPIMADYNGDGLTDFYFFQHASNSVPIIYSTGRGSFEGITIKLPDDFGAIFNQSDVVKLSGDFDGDGLPDFAGFKTGYVTVPVLSTALHDSFSGTIVTIAEDISPFINEKGAVQQSGDFNGDGLIDILVFNNGYKSAPILYSDGKLGFDATLTRYPDNVSDYVNAKDAKQYLGDFNGDGLTDISVFLNRMVSIPVLIGKGNGSFEGNMMDIPAGQEHYFTDSDVLPVLGDINGDKITDIVGFKTGLKTVPSLISQSENSFVFTNAPMTDEMANYINDQDVERFIGDFNGDGLIDIAAIKQGFVSLPILVSNKFDNLNNQPELLLEIDNGIKGIATIEYRPITDSVVYTNTSTIFEYPQLQQQFTQFVVSGYQWEEASQEVPILLEYEMHYKGAVVDHFRGFLGFENKITNISNSNLRTDQHFLVTFPYKDINDKTTISDLEDTSMILEEASGSYQWGNINSNAIYTVWQKSNEQRHYTQGHYNYTTKQEFKYNSDFSSIVQLNDFGDLDENSDNVYSYFEYFDVDKNSSEWWKGFFPVAEKAKNDTTETADWNNWEVGDYYWDSFEYDERMNMTKNLSFMNTNGEQLTNYWVGEEIAYDEYGNEVSSISRSNKNAEEKRQTFLEYDQTFHTYPVKSISAQNDDGIRLENLRSYDPRFGIKTQEVDANKQIVYMIPDKGIDGFGRILEEQKIQSDGDDLELSAIYDYENGQDGGMSIISYQATQWTSTVRPDSTWLFEKTFFNGFDSVVNVSTNGFSDNSILSAPVEFDQNGRRLKEYIPYYTDGLEGVYYHKWEYDPYGRMERALLPAPDSSGNLVVGKEIIRDEGDDRILYVKSPSPVGDTQNVLYRYVYDVHERLIEKSGPYVDIGKEGENFGIAKYSYDALGQLVESTDPLGLKQIREYNSLGELILEYKAETDTVKYVYNHNNLLVSKIGLDGSEGFEYDDLDRIIKKTVQGADGDIQSQFFYTFDNDSISKNSLGRLSCMKSSVVDYIYGYDNRGNVNAKTTYLHDLEKYFIEAYSYDAADRLVSIIYPDGSLLSHSYNYGGAVSHTLINSDTLARYLSYNVLGEVEQIKYGNKVVSSMKYDMWGRLTESNTGNAISNYYEAGYLWSNSNKVVQIQDRRLDKGVSLDQHFQYSQAGRLLRAEGSYGKEVYSYDPAGNRLTLNDFRYEYAKDKRHQLIDVKENGLSVSKYSYSAQGNLAGKSIQDETNSEEQSFSYHFDGEGNLSHVTSKDETLASFGYNDLGDRVSKNEGDSIQTYYVSPLFEASVLPSKDTIYTKYVHDEGGVLYAETLGSGSTNLMQSMLDTSMTKKGNMNFAFTWEDIQRWSWYIVLFLIILIFLWTIRRLIPQRNDTTCSPAKTLKWGILMATSMLLILPPNAYAGLTPGENGSGVPVDGEKRFFHSNHLGSSTLLTDEKGELMNSIAYTPFGIVDAENSSGEDSFRSKFTGKEEDNSLGLYYFGSRFYDGHLGRFISPDPANQYFSPYVYGDGDPLSGIDPNGEEFTLLVAAIVTLTAAATTYVGISVGAGSFNPRDWDFGSARTWLGLIAGLAASTAIIATSGAAAIGGAIAAGIGGISYAVTSSEFNVNDFFLTIGGDFLFGSILYTPVKYAGRAVAEAIGDLARAGIYVYPSAGGAQYGIFAAGRGRAASVSRSGSWRSPAPQDFRYSGFYSHRLSSSSSSSISSSSSRSSGYLAGSSGIRSSSSGSVSRGSASRSRNSSRRSSVSGESSIYPVPYHRIWHTEDALGSIMSFVPSHRLMPLSRTSRSFKRASTKELLNRSPWWKSYLSQRRRLRQGL